MAYALPTLSHPSALPSHLAAPPTMTFASPGSPPAHPTPAVSPARLQMNKCLATRRTAARRRSAKVSARRPTCTYSQQHNRPLAIRLQRGHRVGRECRQGKGKKTVLIVKHSYAGRTVLPIMTFPDYPFYSTNTPTFLRPQYSIDLVCIRYPNLSS